MTLNRPAAPSFLLLLVLPMLLVLLMLMLLLLLMALLLHLLVLHIVGSASNGATSRTRARWTLIAPIGPARFLRLSGRVHSTVSSPYRTADSTRFDITT